MGHAVEMRGIVKIYRETGLRANDGVDLTLEKGEILCLAGENGAGKTTLMKVLYGLEHPDAGSISIMGKEAVIDSPLVANRLGIGMVHQHFMLIDDFTVAQNVTLGKEPLRYGVAFDLKKAEQEVSKLIKEHHFSIEASKKVGSLTIGQKQQVEIIKMLYRDVDILILDEPTAVLTEQEIDALFLTLRALVARGTSLILITHKLHEIKRISDRVTVMRQGKMVGEFATEVVDEKEISRAMMGRSVSLQIERVPYSEKKEPILQFDKVSLVRKNQERPLLNAISFTAYSGEILGFAGVGGNGLGELESVLSGFLPITSGGIFHKGVNTTKLDTHALRQRGLAYVPADRLHTGSALEADVAKNMIVDARNQFSQHGVLQHKRIVQHTTTLMQTYGVQGTPDMPIGTLSGGNIQKVILAREIEQYRDYIVFSEPTWGLDVSSSRFVYERIAQLRGAGAAVILISSNLDEILAASDRVIVFYRGSIVAVLTRDEIRQVSKEEMGAYMLGLKKQGALHE
ncbi:MAG: ABC transporter ATP-binding protein [Sphaerochaetaceae bacterium]|jgi:simple sugar transport system ATP-binding protein|nr:ABC transporter ATP-binding protein [Sphaerochaetaceae bacterium]MDY0371330.1 ABC transporter ATP-binding protein [Sphaerochaetaceae bacterium]